MSSRPSGQIRPSASPRRAEGISAVVVTYRPGEEVPANIAAIRAQVALVVVVDNGATAESRARLASLAGQPGIELIFNPDNRGVAAALNQGMERAQAGSFAWLATFDQDSRLPVGFMDGLLAAHAAWPDRERVAIIAPLYRDRSLGFVSSPGGPLPEGPLHDTAVSVTATSGNLVALRALQAVGGFREDFFIDCVDFELCLRCRRAGWQVLEARGVVLDHAQGRWERRRLLWRTPRVNDYDAMRRYYQVRNRLVLYARLGGVDIRWTLRDAWGFGWDFLKLILFCHQRPAKLRAMFTGACDALRGRMGPRPA